MKTLEFLVNCNKHHQSTTQQKQIDQTQIGQSDLEQKTTLPCDMQSTPQQQCQMTEEYVSHLLSQKLQDFGFQVDSDVSAQQRLLVRVEHHPVQLSVHCRKQGVEGQLHCEISAYSDEVQDWFSKIATQSMTKQLAQAVEQSLKSDACFEALQWQERAS